MNTVRVGHGSVRAGFSPFGHPICAPQVGEFSTRDIKEKVETRRVFKQFGVEFFGRVGRANRVARTLVPDRFLDAGDGEGVRGCYRRWSTPATSRLAATSSISSSWLKTAQDALTSSLLWAITTYSIVVARKPLDGLLDKSDTCRASRWRRTRPWPPAPTSNHMLAGDNEGWLRPWGRGTEVWGSAPLRLEMFEQKCESCEESSRVFFKLSRFVGIVGRVEYLPKKIY